MKSKPENETEVFEVMKTYAIKKHFTISDKQLELLSENCFLHYESKSWSGTTYWPPLAMKWLLNNIDKIKPQYKESKPMTTHTGKTVREILMEKAKDVQDRR